MHLCRSASLKACICQLWFMAYKYWLWLMWKALSGRQPIMNDELSKKTIELDPHQSTGDLTQKLSHMQLPMNISSKLEKSWNVWIWVFCKLLLERNLRFSATGFLTRNANFSFLHHFLKVMKNSFYMSRENRRHWL